MNEKVCAIVGVGPGIGLAVARRFGGEDFQIALMARRTKTLQGYVRKLSKEGIEAFAFTTDAANPDSLKWGFEQVRVELGHPDVLIYNAVKNTTSVPSTLALDDLISDFAVNVGGALVATQQVIPHMRRQQRGTILFTGGGMALNPTYSTQWASLSIGKAGMRNLALCLSAELEDDGIHVATVTVRGYVKPGTDFDPDKIAETYWMLHTQAPGEWQNEVLYTG